MIEKNNKEELIRLIQENPELPLVFCVNNEYVAFDYASSIMKIFYCYVGKVWELDDEVIFDDEDYIIEHYEDILCDDDKYKNLSDEEFENVVKDYVKNNVEYYKAIIVSIYA